MEKLFVPYSIALALKEKGYNEPCFGCYVHTTVGYIFVDYMYPHIRESLITAGMEEGFCETIETPLYQQVIDWFRETHNIWIHIYHNVGWEFEIIFMDDREKTGKYQDDYYENNKPNFPVGGYYPITILAIKEALTLI